MNENENDFETLRRLLAFKNRETPPPGYFNNFASRVIARIQAGEQEAVSGNWFVRFVQSLELKPAFAGTFAAALCLVLVFGIVYAERPDDAPKIFLPQAQVASVSPSINVEMPASYVPPTETSTLFDSTNPVMNLDSGSYATLSGQQNPYFQQVNFNLGN
ncbi:MAG TPA: hypothetical protein VMB22_07515 [Verrucomicrobiae bacterium]|nr:hypothetical protein [Verrucomicrobiae bacterium]